MGAVIYTVGNSPAQYLIVGKRQRIVVSSLYAVDAVAEVAGDPF